MNKEHISVDILLSTYNGELFLEGQIDSIIGQSFTQWRLIVRDDDSTDSTKDILKKYSEKDSRIIIEDNLGNLGPCQSFLELLKHSSSKYIMFCDQDDIWLPEKIETMVEFAEAIKKNGDKDLPCLIVSDLKAIDEFGRIISDSFWNLQELNPQKKHLFKDLIVQNKFPGCSMLFNKPLRDLCIDTPQNALMHDWWVCLIASAIGKVEIINSPLTLYRIHSSNTIGLSESSVLKSLLRFIERRPSSIKNISNPERTLGINQAKTLLEKLDNRLSKEQKRILECIIKPSISGCMKSDIHREPLSSDLIFYIGLSIIKLKKLFGMKNNARK